MTIWFADIDHSILACLKQASRTSLTPATSGPAFPHSPSQAQARTFYPRDQVSPSLPVTGSAQLAPRGVASLDSHESGLGPSAPRGADFISPK